MRRVNTTDDDEVANRDAEAVRTDEEVIELRRENTSNDGPQVSFVRFLMGQIIQSALTGLSYDFSGMELAIIPIINEISNTSQQRAAIPVIINYLSLSNMAWLSPLFAMNQISEKLGELKTEEEKDPNSEACQKLREEISTINNAGILLAIALSIPFIITMIWSSFIVKIFGQDHDVASYVQEYTRIFAIAILLGLAVRCAVEQTLLNFKYAAFAMVVAVADLVGFSFLAKFWGELEGITGVAKANAMQLTVTSLLYSVFLFLGPAFKRYSFFTGIFSDFKSTVRYAGKLFLEGLPITLTNVIEVIYNFMFVILAGIDGVEEQSALTGAMFVMFLAAIFNWASAIVGGQSTKGMSGELMRLPVGQRNYKLITLTSAYGLIAAIILNWISLIIVTAYPQILSKILSNNDDTSISLMYSIARRFGIAAMAATVWTFLSQQTRALSRPYISMGISSIGMIAGLIMSVMSLVFLDKPMRIYGVANGYVAGYWAAAALLLCYWIWLVRPSKLKANIEIENNEASVHFDDKPASLLKDVSGDLVETGALGGEKLLPPFIQKPQDKEEERRYPMKELVQFSIFSRCFSRHKLHESPSKTNLLEDRLNATSYGRPWHVPDLNSSQSALAKQGFIANLPQPATAAMAKNLQPPPPAVAKNDLVQGVLVPGLVAGIGYQIRLASIV